MSKFCFMITLLCFLLMGASAVYSDTVSGDPPGPIWVKGTDGTRTYCYVVGSGTTKKVICHSY